MTKIAVLCPTMGRPELLQEMLTSLEATAYDLQNVSIILGTNKVDKSLMEYENLVRERRATGMNISMTVFPDWTLPMCNNVMAYEEKADIYLASADDLKFETPDWDKALRDSYGELKNKIHVWSLLDGRDENSNAILAMSREYTEVMGYMVPPIFMHWYCDTWTAAITKHVGCFTHLKNYKVTHDKKSEQGIKDDTYDRIRRIGGPDRDNHTNDKCQHFLRLEAGRLKEALEE